MVKRDFNRTLRIGDQIQRDLSTLIMREVKDPRLGMVTITDVEVSRDLSIAKVFITILEDDNSAKVAEHLDILSSASGYLRTLLGKSMRLRVIPQLKFIFDDSTARGANIAALINRARSLDSE